MKLIADNDSRIDLTLMEVNVPSGTSKVTWTDGWRAIDQLRLLKAGLSPSRLVFR